MRSHSSLHVRPQRRARSAFSMAELMVVLAVMTVAMGLFTQTMAATGHMDPVAEETAIAAEAARSKLEELRGLSFREIFTRYNASGADDPAGPNTAPGPFFAVPGLLPPPGAAAVGVIVFPAIGSELREDIVNDQLGMPRDLNNDGLVDAQDHAQDCILLPLKVRLEWASKCGHLGKRSFEICAMFGNF
jgi:type II secretory pathway pseudopilin PulG